MTRCKTAPRIRGSDPIAIVFVYLLSFICSPHTQGNSQSKIKTKAGEEGGRALNKELEKKC
jgi:hypothetical protein